ncbi:putative bifunctional polynucleotide phosphatase/kinase [Cladorrhinum sp. PSN332]|nr:putative bifunctional polynucleotide phosphatase/kinase [Cladorrhinum sp. PSN332]
MQATLTPPARCAIRPFLINAAYSRVFSPRFIQRSIISSMSPTENSDAPTLAGRKRSAPDSRPISPPPMKRKAAQATISKSTVANFFTPASQKPKEPTVWTERSPDKDTPATLLVAKYVSPDKESYEKGKAWLPMKRKKIAAFDLDSTLITSASGKKHADQPGDWKWWHYSICPKLRLLYEDEFQVIVFTNQGGLTLHPDPKAKAPPKGYSERVANFKKKCNAVLSSIGIPEITLYAATGKDMFRKPRTGMWDEMLKDFELSPEEVQLHLSFLVGDAGGRVATISAERPTIPKDFSCSDRNMAANIGIKFLTPEEFFLEEKPREFARDFDLEKWPFKEGENLQWEMKHEKEILLFVGPPGAGKSTFFWKVLNPLGYVRINQDTLKTKAKCLKAAEDWLKEKSVALAIDATNPDPDTRAQWVEFSEKHKVPIRCVWFKTPLELCAHNDAVRGLNKNSKAHNIEGRDLLPQLAFNMFKSRFKVPTEKEGFEEVVPVEFKFSGTEEEYQVWGRYWV